jgi:mRNA interferase RelE/StbE
MAYDIQFAELAAADVAGLTARCQSTILTAIESHLRHEPTKESRSRIKRLRGIQSPQYRLRVDEYRVLYDVDLSQATVTVLAIVNKNQLDSWLSAFAEKSNDPSSSRSIERSTDEPPGEGDPG